jgi:hypothetical protein
LVVGHSKLGIIRRNGEICRQSKAQTYASRRALHLCQDRLGHAHHRKETNVDLVEECPVVAKPFFRCPGCHVLKHLYISTGTEVITRASKNDATNRIIRLDRIHMRNVFERYVVIERIQDLGAVKGDPRPPIFDLQSYDVSH